MRDKREIRTYIDAHRHRRQSNKVLHGHPSPVFWLDRDVSVPAVMHDRRRAARGVRKRINLYVGTPYCLPTDPGRCGFCLFPTEVYRDRQQLDTYLDYLAREGEMFRPHLEGAELASIYFGGGTSNLYKADQYAALMNIVRGVFDVPPDIEVTLEGIPQTFSHEKLAAMQACGINRISMGAQQLDDELIKASGRKQTAAQVFRTLDSCRALGLPVSVDLIFGWPNQTTDHMLRDLQALVEAGLTHITHYELNVAGRTDFARNRRDELPSTERNLEMYRIGRDYLVSAGFTQVTPYDFQRNGPLQSSYLYEELFRKPFREDDGQLVGYDAWGWGFAGISFFFGTPRNPGWAYINQTRVDDYFRDLDAGRFPVKRGFHYSESDLRRHLLCPALQRLEVARR
ncbi:MAG: radical SAM protein, partial [Acidobacteria bacterium]|nr:radical SAM protein [Acidobacteriota bacterium]